MMLGMKNWIVEVKDNAGRWYQYGASRYTKDDALATARFCRLRVVGRVVGTIPGYGVAEDVRAKEVTC